MSRDGRFDQLSYWPFLGKFSVTEGDLRLLVIAFSAVALLVLLIASRLRLHPLIALLLASLFVGFTAGMPAETIAKTITDGAGHTLGVAGLVLALGAMLGKILADSGVTEALAEGITSRSSDRGLPWAMALAAFVIGIPMFFEVGLVVLLPLIFSVAKKYEERNRAPGSAYVLLGTPVIAALCAMHGMTPPHPGPLTAIAVLKAPIAPTLVYGFIAAVPAIILGGPLYARFIAPRLTVRPDQALLDQYTMNSADGVRPSITLGLLAVLMPALLMLTHAVAEFMAAKDTPWVQVTAFLGHPVIAMLVGLVFACVMLVYARGGNRELLRENLGASLKPIANILLIIAGGGAFQQVLVKAKVGDAIIHMTQHFALPPLVLAWLISLLLSLATGSVTVGIVGAAGLLAPLVAADPSLNSALFVLAIGSGSIALNYANHAGFWFVKETFGMTMAEATKTITVIQTIVSVVGLVMVLLFNMMPRIM